MHGLHDSHNHNNSSLRSPTQLMIVCVTVAYMCAESPRVEGDQAAQHQKQEVRVLAALAHQLVQDVGDDQDSYQQAFGTRSICLPAVTCR